jgi:hypothetical protein
MNHNPRVLVSARHGDVTNVRGGAGLNPGLAGAAWHLFGCFQAFLASSQCRLVFGCYQNRIRGGGLLKTICSDRFKGISRRLSI